MGGILSGQTVCGLLIGSIIAIGLRYGQGKEGIPEEHSEDVTRWIQEKGWKSTCDVYLKFAMNKCVEMAEDGKV